MTIDAAKFLRERLRVLRESKGLSQKEVEDGIGKEANYITRVETGRIEWPPSDAIDKICEFLQVSPSELFFAEGLDEMQKFSDRRSKICSKPRTRNNCESSIATCS